MSDVKFTLPWTDAVTVSGQAIEKLVGAGDGDAALVYLYILRTRGAGSIEETGRALGLARDDVTAAMTRLDKLGLIMFDTRRRESRQRPEPPAPPAGDELPEYTAEDVRRGVNGSPAFRELVDEVQKALGKLLSSDDLARLYGMYDNLGLPPEVILHLVNYCMVCSRTREGAPRMPTMRYIEKAAYTWERAGVFSLERAEALIKELEARRSASAEIRAALGIKDRELSASEQRYVDGWLAMGFKPDAVSIAYDRTLLNTGKLAWKYMDSIINNWHGKGLHTAEEIQRGDARRRAPNNAEKNRRAPEPEELQRMARLLGDL
ncbi:MAG: DnaD domain protein [Oscillospiraceae bacterium]|jgi:DNA replication protein DnaD|nr:DnaD domain protein [Oscillospiraceae bacterium]